MASLPRAVPSDTLPVPRTSLVGRAAELARARHLLLDGAAPLVTLTGPGGVGKTRLALAIAHDVAAAFADGAVFVDLAPLRDPALVLPAIAQAVGVREEGDRPLPALLASYLRPRQLLLVLDNVEHVLPAVSQVAGLLAGCPALQVLATSRAPLRIRGEHLFVVPPLTLPDPDRPPPLEELAHVEALALFAQRAHAADATFAFTEANAPSVTEVCRRLDGLPLAIELAAARLRALSPAALLALLSDRLRVLTGGERDLPERQRTLGAAIAWSYDLLTPPEQALFRRLSVFVGGFDVDAAAAVLGAEPGEVVDLLLALADQSLLRRVPDPENRPRFGMLETVREFASQALHERGEADGARRAHSVHYRDLAERCEAALYGPEMRRWLDRFALEHPNNLAALDYFVERGESTNELRLAAMLSEHWFFRGNLREGVARLAGAVARGQSAPPGPLAKALSELSLLCHVTGDAGRAVEFSARSVPLSRAAGDANRLTQSLSIHAISLGESGQHEPEIVSLLDEAVDWATNSTLPAPHLPNVLGDIGESLIRRGERSRGVAVIEEAIGRNLLIGNNWSAGMQLATLGRLELEAGNAERAAGRFGEALRLIWNAGVEMQVGFPVSSIAVLAMERGLAERAAGLVGAVEGIMERTGAVPEIHSSAFERARRLGPLYLGDDAYANAAAAGRRRPLAEAVAEALEVAGVLATTAPAVVPPPAPAARASARSAQGRPDPGMRFGLSPREREVLAMLVARQSDKDISEQLFISPRTVMTHATNIFTKLGVANRREAAAVAVRHALV